MAVSSGPALVSMAQQFSGLPMGDLIGGPLMAAAKANNQMAITQVKFMLDSCFSKTTTGEGDKVTDSYQPIMIDMKMTRPIIKETNAEGKEDIKIEVAESTITLPLLTILPLNALAVDDVNINFNMEVKSSFANEQSQEQKESFEAGGSFSAKAGYGPFSVEVSGNVSSSSESSSSNKETYEKSNKATYDVKVHAGQLPLPEGVGVIIKAYTNNIAPIELKAGSGDKS
ncbi:DUF2589 domain-containing protein [Photobacterium chitinilyticum]|nr:DUF2589 domain-containing protein [Photobacterium chitinilyticum]